MLIILNLYLQKSSLELILLNPGNSIIPSKHHQIRLVLIFPDPDQKWCVTTTSYIMIKNGKSNITGIYVSSLHNNGIPSVSYVFPMSIMVNLGFIIPT